MSTHVNTQQTLDTWQSWFKHEVCHEKTALKVFVVVIPNEGWARVATPILRPLPVHICTNGHIRVKVCFLVTHLTSCPASFTLTSYTPHKTLHRNSPLPHLTWLIHNMCPMTNTSHTTHTQYMSPSWNVFLKHKMIFSRATSLRAPSFGGVRTWVEGLSVWSSHNAAEASNLRELVAQDLTHNSRDTLIRTLQLGWRLGWAATTYYPRYHPLPALRSVDLWGLRKLWETSRAREMLVIIADGRCGWGCCGTCGWESLMWMW